MNRKLIISLMLSAALFAPQAQAMSGLLQRARQVAAMVMKSGLTSKSSGRSALLAQGSTHAMSRVLSQPVTPQVSRSFSASAPQSSIFKPMGDAWAFLHINEATLTDNADQHNLIPRIKNNKQYAQKALVLINPTNIERIGKDILLALLEALPETAARLIGCINKDTIFKIDPSVLLDVIKKSPDSKKLFIEYVGDNPVEKLYAGPHGFRTSCWNNLFIELAQEQLPCAYKIIPHIYLANEDSFDSFKRQELLKQLCPRTNRFFGCYSEYIENAAYAAAKDLIDRPEGQENRSFNLFKALINYNMESSFDKKEYLELMVERSPRAYEVIKDAAIRDCIKLISTKEGRSLIALVLHAPSVKEALKRALQHYEVKGTQEQVDVAWNGFVTTSKDNCSAAREDHTQTLHAKNILQWAKGIGYYLNSTSKPTPTEIGRLQNSFNDKNGSTFIEYRGVRQLDTIDIDKQLLDEVIALERRYQDTHWTFVHGRKLYHRFREKIYCDLWEQWHGKNAGGFKFLKFINQSKPHDIQEDQSLYEKVMGKGYCNGCQTTESEFRNMMGGAQFFMNTHLFSNRVYAGNSAVNFYYFGAVGANSGHYANVKDVFSCFSQSALYEKYEADFAVLEKEHCALSKSGEMLVVAVPKNKVRDLVTVVGITAGEKYFPDGTQTNLVKVNGVNTDDVEAILKARQENPHIGEGLIDFTIPLTQNAGLNPDSGIKIHSVDEIDKQKLAAWQKKYDALMAKVLAEFKDKNQMATQEQSK